MVVSMVFAWTFLGGKLVDNKVVGASNFSVSTTSHKITVPTGKRWIFMYGNVYRDVNTGTATLVIDLKDSGDELLLWHCVSVAAGTGHTSFPGYSIAAFKYPFVLEAGDYLEFTFGEAQGAAAYIIARVLEVDA